MHCEVVRLRVADEDTFETEKILIFIRLTKTRAVVKIKQQTNPKNLARQVFFIGNLTNYNFFDS